MTSTITRAKFYADAPADRDLPVIRGTIRVSTRRPLAESSWWRLHAGPGHIGPMRMCEPACRAASGAY